MGFNVNVHRGTQPNSKRYAVFSKWTYWKRLYGRDVLGALSELKNEGFRELSNSILENIDHNDAAAWRRISGCSDRHRRGKCARKLIYSNMTLSILLHSQLCYFHSSATILPIPTVINQRTLSLETLATAFSPYLYLCKC